MIVFRKGVFTLYCGTCGEPIGDFDTIHELETFKELEGDSDCAYCRRERGLIVDGYSPKGFKRACLELLGASWRERQHSNVEQRIDEWMAEHPKDDYSADDLIECYYGFGEVMSKHNVTVSTVCNAEGSGIFNTDGR